MTDSPLAGMRAVVADAEAGAAAGIEAQVSEKKAYIARLHFRDLDKGAPKLIRKSLTADEHAYVAARKGKKKGKMTENCNADTLEVVCEVLGI